MDELYLLTLWKAKWLLSIKNKLCGNRYNSQLDQMEGVNVYEICGPFRGQKGKIVSLIALNLTLKYCSAGYRNNIGWKAIQTWCNPKVETVLTPFGLESCPCSPCLEVRWNNRLAGRPSMLVRTLPCLTKYYMEILIQKRWVGRSGDLAVMCSQDRT